jgi:YD repeat-containing protein
VGESCKTLGELDLLTIHKTDAHTEQAKDARGLTTTTVYNAARLPLKVIYPDGASETTSYDPIYNQKTSHTNALGVVSTWAYDPKGNVLAWVEAKGQPEQRTTRYSWDQWGNLLSKTRGSGDGQGGDAITETYTYDNAGNTTKGTNGLGHTTSATHSAQGQTLTATNPLGHTARHTYDAAGNLTSSTNALGQSTKFSYDGRARRTQVTSAAGRVQTTSYDKAGRITETLALGQAAGQGTRVQYDAAGRPVQTTSPSGLISKTSYDSQGRTASTQDPAGNTTSYEYGAKGSPLAGLLVTVNYPTYKESYGYDQRGRQTVTHRHLDATTTLSQRQAFDAEGQRLSSTDPAGKTTLYQYDGLGRMVQTIDATGGKTQQTWDAQDNLTSLTDAKGNKHQFSYDKAGRLTKETRPMGGAIGYAYDAAGNLTTRTDAGGNTRSYTYNQAGRMTAEVHKLNGRASATATTRTVNSPPTSRRTAKAA